MIFNGYSTLKYFLWKMDKVETYNMDFLLQEFNIEIRAKKGVKNAIDYLLFRIVTELKEEEQINDKFP